jgi:hypothetical protein
MEFDFFFVGAIRIKIHDIQHCLVLEEKRKSVAPEVERS